MCCSFREANTGPWFLHLARKHESLPPQLYKELCIIANLFSPLRNMISDFYPAITSVHLSPVRLCVSVRVSRHAQSGYSRVGRTTDHSSKLSGGPNVCSQWMRSRRTVEKQHRAGTLRSSCSETKQYFPCCAQTTHTHDDTSKHQLKKNVFFYSMATGKWSTSVLSGHLPTTTGRTCVLLKGWTTALFLKQQNYWLTNVFQGIKQKTTN